MAAPSDRPLAGLVLSVAGPGRVGASLARWAAASGAEVRRIGARALRPAVRTLAAELDAEPVGLAELTSEGDDVLLVAVADPALVEVAAALGRRPQAAAALHTSGSRGAAALAPLRGRGSAVGSLHPLMAFPHPLPDLASARGVTFAVDGDPAARAAAVRLADAWGATALEVPAEARDLYHLAATLAAGGVTTLLATAASIARGAGLPERVAAGYLELARGALAAAGEELAAGRGLAGAITGPAARGDAETVRRQLTALARERPELVPLVVRLARETLARLAEAGPEGDERRALGEVLDAFGGPPRAGA